MYLVFCFKVINVIEENFPHEHVLVRKKEINCTRSINSGFSIQEQICMKWEKNHFIVHEKLSSSIVQILTVAHGSN